jgi:hypothetical protein
MSEGAKVPGKQGQKPRGRAEEPERTPKTERNNAMAGYIPPIRITSIAIEPDLR